MRHGLFFLFMALLVHLSFAQHYLWPTSASKYLSASFCEYRPGHYHSAIDIKTWNREGFPVFAIDDGFLYRVRVSPYGYGKVIYLKLNDGRFAVYAHLQRFNKKIEQAVRRVQLQKKRYSIDWRPKKWPVKKGEIIAFTGQTGIGVPHLHFEIRDPQNHPLNPLQFFKNQIKDTIAPKLQELLFIPLNKFSTVNGSVLPTIIPLKKQNGIYRLIKPVYARGKIGIAVRGFDRANDVYNKYGFYQEALYIDDHLTFKASYDTLDFGKTAQIDLEIYYPLKALKNKQFHKLFKEPFNDLDFLHTDQTSGLLTLGGEKQSFRIVISDYAGNASVVKGQILPEFETSPRILLARQLQNQLFVQLQTPAHLQTLSLYHSHQTSDWQMLKSYEIVQQQFKPHSQHLLLRATLNPTAIKNLKIVGLTNDKRQFRLTHNFSVPQDSLSVKFINLGRYWVVRYAPLQNLQKFSIQTILNNRPVQPVTHFHQQILEQVISPGPQSLQTLRVVVKKFEKTLFDSTVHFAVLYPARQQELNFFHDSLQIRSPKGALYDTTIIRLKKDETILNARDSLPVLSPEFIFDWYPQPLKKSIALSVRYDSSNLPAGSIGCYRTNKKQQLAFLGNHVDSINHKVTAYVRGFPRFVAASDTIPPLVEVVNLSDQQTLSSLPNIKISVDDALSGLDSDRNFRIFMDEKWLIPEWDPERKQVLVSPYWQLKNGSHTLQIEVTDRAGNVTKKSIKFFIKRETR